MLAGWSQSGKDTTADFLVQKYGFKKFAFADAPKRSVSTRYNFPYEWTLTQEGKSFIVQTEKGVNTVRDLIIEYANTERTKNPFAWAEVIAEEIKNAITKGQAKFVISDWRLIDELTGLQRELVTFKPQILPIQIRRPDQLVSPVTDRTEYSLLGFPFYLILENTMDTYFFNNIAHKLYNLLGNTIE